jgi:hypothetical protein
MVHGAYKRHVKRLSEQLQPLIKPAFCQAPTLSDHLAGPASRHTASNFSPTVKWVPVGLGGTPPPTPNAAAGRLRATATAALAC